jgi:hypothetical protein
VRKNPLTTASEMIGQFGDKAELLAGDRMDAALQADDRESYDEWCLVAKAIALLTRHHPEPANAKAKPKTKTPAQEPGLLKRMLG